MVRENKFGKAILRILRTVLYRLIGLVFGLVALIVKYTRKRLVQVLQ